jgi:hypothetical protein
MKTTRFLLKAAGGLLILGLIIIGVAPLTGNFGRPILWELSPGFRGWVVVKYQRSDCLPLSTTTSIFSVISVLASGQACTSSPMPKGWRYVRYEYVLGDGRRSLIPSSGWGSNSEIKPISVNSEKRMEVIFVGSQQELNKNW